MSTSQLLCIFGGAMLMLGLLITICAICSAAKKPMPNPDDAHDERAFSPTRF